MKQIKIETIPLDKINPAPYNPRKKLTDSDPQKQALRRSIEEFGLVEVLAWNKRTGNLVSGKDAGAEIFALAGFQKQEIDDLITKVAINFDTDLLHSVMGRPEDAQRTIPEKQNEGKTLTITVTGEPEIFTAEWEFYMRVGFAEQILKLQGRSSDPETVEKVLAEAPATLLKV